MSEKRQHDLWTDFPRGEQLRLLRKLRLERFVCRDGEGVSAFIQKAVLRAIDDYANDERACFASQQTIADDLNCSVGSVARGIEALTAKSLITNDPREGSTNHHRVVWGEVRMRVRKTVANGRGSIAARDHLPSSDGWGSVAARDHLPSSDGWGSIAATDHLPSSYGLNAKETQTLTATSTATLNEGWRRLRDDLSSLGMKAAPQATASAHERRWSLAYCRELIHFATSAERNGSGERPGVGHLCNWMTGKTLPPFDEDEGEQRYATRRAREATEITEKVNAALEQREDVDDEFKARARYGELQKGGYEDQASPEDRAAFQRFEDRKRKAKTKPSTERT